MSFTAFHLCYLGNKLWVQVEHVCTHQQVGSLMSGRAVTYQKSMHAHGESRGGETFTLSFSTTVPPLFFLDFPGLFLHPPPLPPSYSPPSWISLKCRGDASSSNRRRVSRRGANRVDSEEPEMIQK